MGNSANWETVKLYLDNEAYTYAFADLRGYGRSKNQTGAYTAQEAGDDVFRIADALGWSRFHVVGHSMTGLVVQRMALDDWKSGRRRLKSVVAITPVGAAGVKVDADSRAFFASAVHVRDKSEGVANTFTGNRLAPGFARRLIDLGMGNSEEAVRGYLRMYLDTDIAAEVQSARVETPFLVIGGRQDAPLFSEEALRANFTPLYPSLSFEFVESAGHYPMYETPPRLARLMDGFIASHR
jgi:pimeloyl-ACP methyl ester carboxylesterase